MKITRRYTEAGKSPYETIPFRRAVSEIKNPDGSVVFRLDGFMVPEHWSQVAADILAQKYFRKAGVPKRLRKVEETQVPSWLWRSSPRQQGARRPAREGAHRQRDRCPPGVRPSRRHLDLLGLEGRLLHDRGGRPRVLRRAPLHAGDADGRAEQPAVVQHRPALGLRHRRPRPGPLLRRPPDRRADVLDLGLRASAAARLLHPVGRGRSRQRERHHGPVGARSAPVQVRLRHRHQLLLAARRERAPVGRRPLVRPDELPQDRRPRRRRDQVGRHHAPRRQDGGRRRRSSGHRGIHRLEGEGGAEGRRPRHRLEDLPEAAQGDHEGLRQLRRGGRCDEGGTLNERCFDPAKNPKLKPAIKEARRDQVPDNYILRVIQFARQGFKEIDFATYDTDWDSEAYLTVSGQNSNNSVRVTDEFLQRRRRATRTGSSPAATRTRSRRPSRPASCGRRSATPPGRRPIPASSSTPPSTTGTPARSRGRSARRTRARSTCSSTTRRATSRRST